MLARPPASTGASPINKYQVYPGALPRDVDALNPQRATEIALGAALRAAFGITTVIDGLAVTQQASPNMTVQVGPGSIIFATTIDTVASGFGALAYDGSTPLVKIGVNTGPVNMSAITAPAVAGQSQNWLIEAQFLEADTTPVVLPYYNASNPTIPFTGPSNAGTPNTTIRAQTVQLQWKGGTPATTGQQNTPTPDAGWVGVAIVTVANGQATITNSNISPYSAAPYVPTKLPFQRTKLTSNLTMYISPFGNDANNSGLAASSPFLTMQKAWNYIVSNLDLNGFIVTVQMANGTYTAALSAQGAVVGNTNGYSGVVFIGNTGSPSSVTISIPNGPAFQSQAGAAFTISGMTITCANGHGLYANLNGTIAIGASVVFGACGGGSAHMYCNNGSTIAAIAGYTISGGATNHWNAQGNAGISVQGFTITLTGTPAFTIFAASALAGVMSVQGNTFSGSATGQRYYAVTNGVINVNGAATTYLPGSTVGSTVSGGQYV